MQRTKTLMLALVAATAACASPMPPPGEASTPAAARGTDGQVGQIDGQDGRPSAAPVALEVVSPTGQRALAVDADGLVRAEVRLVGQASVRTIGLRLVATGAQIVEWSRDDAFLTSAGGQVLQVAGRAEQTALELAVATTAPAPLGAGGARLMSVTLRPTSSSAEVSLEVAGDSRGVIDASGQRLAVDVRAAALHAVPNATEGR